MVKLNFRNPANWMIRHQHLQLVLILLLGATLRFWHLDWGTNPQDGRFHAMHPDEKGLIHASSQLAESLRPTLSSYGALSLYLPWVTWPVAQVLSIDLFDENHPRDTFILCRALSATAGLAALACIIHESAKTPRSDELESRWSAWDRVLAAMVVSC